MTALQWTELPDKSGKTMTVCKGTYPELAQRILTVGTFRGKDYCPWIKGATFGNKRSPEGSLRTNENVEAITFVEGDYDAEEVTIEQAQAMLERRGIRALIYPSPSNETVNPPKSYGGPRWRVIAPLSSQHTPGARSALVARLNGALGGILAGESFTLSQGFFFGATPTNNYRVVLTFDDPDEGTCIDALDELDNIAIGKRTSEKPKGDQPGIPKAPIGESLFAEAVEREGRLLATGDGRRQMITSYLGSRSRLGLSHGELRVLADGIAAQYFDPADPMDERNIDAIIKWVRRKDAGNEAPLHDEPADDPLDVSIADLASAASPAPAFLTDELLPADVVTLLGAHGGTGKTTLALVWAVCQAMGLPFLGKPTKAAKVLFYSAEDDRDLLRWKLAEVCVSMFVDPAELAPRLTVIDASAADSVFYVEARRDGVVHGQPTQAFRDLREHLTQTGAQVVILDNASDIYGADEINRAQVRAFIRMLAKLVRPMNGAVLLLAHVDKLTARTGGTQGYSGSTAWHNSVRSRLFLSADEKTGDLLLEHQKSNRGKRADDIRLRWNHGLPTLITDSTEGNPGQPLVDSMRLTPILTLIGEFYKRGEYVSTSTNARNNAYRMLSSEPSYPRGVRAADLWPLLRQAERGRQLHRELYRMVNRREAERWSLAPTAPSAPTEPLSTVGASGAPSAPTGIGGMGESAHTNTKRKRTNTPTKTSKQTAPKTEHPAQKEGTP